MNYKLLLAQFYEWLGTEEGNTILSKAMGNVFKDFANITEVEMGDRVLCDIKNGKRLMLFRDMVKENESNYYTFK